MSVEVALLCIGDGRDEVHERSWESAQGRLPMHIFDEKIVVDDSGHELGFAGAIKSGWEQVLETEADYCFWLEMDFVFERDVPLHAMLGILHNNDQLVQMALLRGPENEAEHEAGGIIQQHPDEYEKWAHREHAWIQHRRFFTTNPNLCPTWIMGSGWPQEEHSEGKFGINLFASDPRLHSAFWGRGETWIEHIGVRTGVGY